MEEEREKKGEPHANTSSWALCCRSDHSSSFIRQKDGERRKEKRHREWKWSTPFSAGVTGTWMEGGQLFSAFAQIISRPLFQGLIAMCALWEQILRNKAGRACYQCTLFNQKQFACIPSCSVMCQYKLVDSANPSSCSVLSHLDGRSPL